jgi:hypothetical protein
MGNIIVYRTYSHGNYYKIKQPLLHVQNQIIEHKNQNVKENKDKFGI